MALTKDQQLLLLRVIEDRLRIFPRAAFQEKLEEAERAYYMTNAQREDADQDSEEKVKSSYEEMGVGIVSPAVDSEVAYLQSTYLSDPRIFSPVSDNEHKEIAAAFGAKIQNDAQFNNWARHFIQFFRDTAKHNLGVVYVPWQYRKMPGIKISNEQENNRVRRERSVNIHTGSAVKHVDLYNWIFDWTVSPADVPMKGEFSGYIEQMSQVQLYRYIQELREEDPEDQAVMNVTPEMWRSATTESEVYMKYYTPQDILPPSKGDIEKNHRRNWLNFAGYDESSNKNLPLQGDYYDVLTLFLRIIPSQYGLSSKTDQQDGVQIWKIVLVNSSYIIFSKEQSNVHDLLPFGVAQPTEDSLGHQARGFAQQLYAPQKLAKELLDRRLASLDRNIEDRAIVNPNYIDIKMFEARRPTGKYPTKSSAADVELDKIYHQIPFQDSTSNLIQEELAFVLMNADELSGINKAGRGQFVKGNRTLKEYMDVMGNADAKQYTRAVAIENQAMQTVKTIVKWNTIQFGDDEEILDRGTGQTTTFRPAEMADVIMDFKLADGLNPASKYMDGEVLNTILTLFLQFSEFNIRYNVTEMTAHFLQQTSGINIAQYELTPEEQAKKQAQLEQQALQRNAGANNPNV